MQAIFCLGIISIQLEDLVEETQRLRWELLGKQYDGELLVQIKDLTMTVECTLVRQCCRAEPGNFQAVPLKV